MGVFLLFLCIFASQVIGGFNTKLPPPAYGNTITILSVDGGAFKGIIPTIVLHHLEKALQIVAKDENAAIVDYFDVIAGTSTGGLIASMLAAPHGNDTSRPVFTTSEILQFYLDYAPSIFNGTDRDWSAWSNFPKYDGEFLHNKARDILKETHLLDALTNLVIPAYDIKKIHPVIFSSFKAKKVPSLNAKISDIAIGTSAAPTLLPPHGFNNGDTEFNLVDGAVVASNPAFLAVSEVIQQLEEKNSDFISVKENESTKILLLSLGTGRNIEAEGINAKTAESYRALIEWPLFFLDRFTDGSIGVINEYYLESLFPSRQPSHNFYLRIEEYNLDPSIDGANVTKENLENIVKVGEKLLEEPVKVMDVISFLPYEKPSEGTNAEALERLAEILYKEKQLRLKRKSIMEKRGGPFNEAITSPLRMFGMK